MTESESVALPFGDSPSQDIIIHDVYCNFKTEFNKIIVITICMMYNILGVLKGDNMYSIEEVVRYSHINEQKVAGITQIANYFQDCTLSHSEDIGLGFRKLEEMHRAWFLTAWQIVVDRYPVYNEKIKINTWAYDFKGMYGYRNFSMEGEDGKQIAIANSIWLYLDTQTMRPIKISTEELEKYNVSDRLDMEYAPRKISIIGEPVTKEKRIITYDQIDNNSHVNNAKYIAMAEEYLPEDYIVGEARVDYRRATKRGEHIYPKVYYNPTEIIVDLCGEDGKSNVIVEFKKRTKIR